MRGGDAFQRLLRVVILSLPPLIWTPSSLAHAAELPENTSLIALGSRVFDMGADASRIRRSDRFIPINRVPWIQEALWDDADLSPTVVHIQTAASGAEYVWHPSKPDLTEAGRSIPEVLKVPGYRVHRYTDTHYILAPVGADDYYAICGTTEDSLMVNGCTVISAYPPDEHIRLRMRVYRRPDQPLNNLAAIARKAESFVRCVLDVTEEVEAGTWAQAPHIAPGGSPDFKGGCQGEDAALNVVSDLPKVRAS
ncbi:hypothetical protein ACW9UR_23815 [Halovulum sp. GXIMD14794]